MSSLEIVNKLLNADAQVKAIVGPRIYPISAPQAVEGPYLVTNMISAADESLINGAGKYPRERVSVDVAGPDADTVVTLGSILRENLPDVIKQTVGPYKDVDVLFADVDFTQPNDAKTAFMRTVHFFIRWRT